MTEITEEEYEAAKLEFHSAITRFFERVDPEAYVGAWLLITHKQSVELEAAGQACVGVLAPTDQSFVITRGLIEIARDGEVLT